MNINETGSYTFPEKHPVFAGGNVYKELETFLGHEKQNAAKWFILADSNTANNCLPDLLGGLNFTDKFNQIIIPSGEENKNINSVVHIWETLSNYEAERNALLINLGGGVLCDLGGFAASTFKRGIRYINLPTTLMAQVDAGIGGKTGFNLGGIKNLVGTFAMPEAVFIQPKFLDTLPERHLCNGFSEMLKYGLIADRNLWNDLKNKSIHEIKNIGLISRCVAIKTEIVEADPKENGIRKILNFGHTIGHAIETVNSEDNAAAVLHGEAVAVGIICEAYISYRKNGLSYAELEDITDILLNVIGKRNISGISISEILQRIKNDKKNKDGKIGCTLISQIGKAEYSHFIDEKDIEESIGFYIKSSER